MRQGALTVSSRLAMYRTGALSPWRIPTSSTIEREPLPGTVTLTSSSAWPEGALTLNRLTV